MADRALADGESLRRLIAQRLEDVAAFNGCVGTFDGNCIEMEPTDPTRWCKYCVQGRAAVLLAEGPAAAEHFCAFCHRRWTGEGGAEHCGDCHREFLARKVAVEHVKQLQTYAMHLYGTEFGGLIERAKVLAILQELPSSPVADSPTWLPIESAPKDGTHVVLFGTLWNDPDQRPRSCVSWYCRSRSDSPAHALGWFFSAPGYTDGFNPTHWMPLPSAPSASAGGNLKKEPNGDR